jgi:hypothetical protein
MGPGPHNKLSLAQFRCRGALGVMFTYQFSAMTGGEAYAPHGRRDGLSAFRQRQWINTIQATKA